MGELISSPISHEQRSRCSAISRSSGQLFLCWSLLDILPTTRSWVIPGGDPSVCALHWVLPSTAVPALTLPPRAVTACPAADQVLIRFCRRRQSSAPPADFRQGQQALPWSDEFMQVGKDFWRRQRIGLLVFQL